MNEEIFDREIVNDPYCQQFKDLVLLIHDVLHDFNDNYIKETINILESDKVDVALKKAREGLRKSGYVLLDHYASSFYTLRDHLLHKNYYKNNLILTLRKIVYQYSNIYSAITNENLLLFDKTVDQKCKAPNGKEILLAITAAAPDDKDKSFIDEIVSIDTIFKSNDKYIVIPVIACSKENVEFFMENFVVNILHMACHGRSTNPQKYLFCLFGSNVSFAKFQDIICQQQFELLFLNSCYSSKFSPNNTAHQIDYNGELSSFLAKDVSDCYYSSLNANASLTTCWANTKMSFHTTPEFSDYNFI